MPRGRRPTRAQPPLNVTTRSRASPTATQQPLNLPDNFVDDPDSILRSARRRHQQTRPTSGLPHTQTEEGTSSQ